MLARDLPEIAIGPGTRVWPPLKIPALSRTRNASTRSFQALAHRPSTLDEVSQNTFRLRKWVEFSGRRHSSSIMALGAADRIHTALGFGGFAPTLMNAGGHAMMTVRMGEEVSTPGGTKDSVVVYVLSSEDCNVLVHDNNHQLEHKDFLVTLLETLQVSQQDMELEDKVPIDMDKTSL